MTINKTKSLSSLCEMLSKSNIMIYHYENRKWWGRKEGRTSKEIDKWDKLSRIWCEKRSYYKNQIDLLFNKMVTSPNKILSNKTKNGYRNLFQVLPLSLMIDMLTIENIKVYDLKKKNIIDAVNKSKNKIKRLKTIIDYSVNKIIKEGKYDTVAEARTF